MPKAASEKSPDGYREGQRRGRRRSARGSAGGFNGCGGLNGRRVGSEQLEAAEAVFTDCGSCAGIVEVDQHVLVGMASEVMREGRDELSWIFKVRVLETLSDIHLMRPAAIVHSGLTLLG